MYTLYKYSKLNDEFFNSFFNNFIPSVSKKDYKRKLSSFEYRTEIKDNKLKIEIFVPGTKKEELLIKLTGDNVLSIKTKEGAKLNYTGDLAVDRNYQLCSTNPKLEDGILLVEFELKEENKTKELKID